MAPIALGVEIAEIELVLEPMMDRRDRTGNFTRNESFAPNRALMVEENAVRSMDSVSLPVIDGDPISVELGGCVGRSRIEWRRLVLRDSLNLSIEL